MFKFAAVVISREAMQERVEEFRRGLEKPVQSAPEDFGDRLKDAVKRRASAFQPNRIQASASEDERFAEQLKQATKERAGKSVEHQQNSPEHNERESQRYEKPNPRPRSLSD